MMSVITQIFMVAQGGPADPRVAPVEPREISSYLTQRAVWDGAQPLLLSLACFLLGTGLLYALWLYRHRDRHPLPHMTFHRLGRAMGLSLGQRLRLWWVARARRLPTPITLMLCPATYDHHVAAYLGRPLAAAEREGAEHGFDLMRRRLFGPGGANP